MDNNIHSKITSRHGYKYKCEYYWSSSRFPGHYKIYFSGCEMLGGVWNSKMAPAHLLVFRNVTIAAAGYS